MDGQQKRDVIFNIIFGIVFILFLFLCAEIILFLCDFSYHTAGYDIFTPEDESFECIGESYVNSRYTNSIEVYSGLNGEQIRLPPKSQNEFRIFLVGGSVAFSSTNQNSMMWALQERYPETNFTFVNFGVNSIGTIRILEFFRSMFVFEPDLVIIHSGNNECLEGFWSETMETKSEYSHRLNSLFLKHSRAYQGLSYLVQKFKIFLGSINPRLVMINNKPRKYEEKMDYSLNSFSNTLIQYEKNLQEMYDIAYAHRVPVVFTTVTYNRLFIPENLSVDKKLGQQLLLEDKPLEAMKYLDFKENLSGFCPYSSTWQLNDVVRKVAKNNDALFVDFDMKVVESFLPGFVGFEYFADHCHFSSWYGELTTLPSYSITPLVGAEELHDKYVSQVRSGYYDGKYKINLYDLWSKEVYSVITTEYLDEKLI